ncbi:MAG: outer membrane protein assembly factor BamB family protein [Planctomycetota bacterium]|jgi:parallel beta-helix repeat protein/predicted outer membrane repeat protein
MKNLIFAFACLLLAVPCSAEIIIVDDDWPYDFNNIQAAINYSTNGDIIYVLPGTYTGPGNRDIDFNGKAITVQSIAPELPDIVAATTIDCNGSDTEKHRGFNFHSGEDANSVLSGLTITNGYNSRGGGISCSQSGPRISNCIITDNRTYFGGGIYCTYYSSPMISNCIISGNSSVYSGGGIYCYDNSSPTITNCTISENIASWENGGGIFCDGASSLKITHSTLNANHAYENGGGIFCDTSKPISLNNCTFAGNSTGNEGGAIYCSSGNLSLTNCTISSNYAQGIANGIFCTFDGYLLMTSCIGADYIYLYSGTADVWFSCIRDYDPDDDIIPFGGAAHYNIDDDPCFVSHGYWADANDTNIPVNPIDPNSLWPNPNAVWVDGDYHLRRNSPCINTGMTNFIVATGSVDMDGQPRIIGPRIDMGADEFEPMITVTKPQGGEVWTNRSTHEIKWSSFGVSGTVDISYSTNNGAAWLTIENNTANTGSYTWHLPGAIDSNKCLVLVEPNTPDSNVACVESGLFAIYPDFIHPTVPSKWKSLGGDFNRTGLSQNYGPEVGCVKWQFQTDAPVSASPTIGAGDRVHIACEDGKLYTLEPDGSLVWTYDVNSPLLSSPSVGPSGSVYVGSQNGKIYAISIAGRLRWTHSTDGFIYSSPAVSPDGKVYACSQDGILYALAQDGSKLWTFETTGPGIASGAIFASPAIGPDGTVYIAGLYDPNLYALDPNDGSVKWACNLADPCDPNKNPWPFASPVVAQDGTIYQTLLYNPKRSVGEPGPEPWYEAVWYDSKLYSIDPNNGSILWATNMTETATQAELCEPWAEPNYWFEQYYALALPPPQGGGILSYPYTITELLGPDFVRYYRVSGSSYSEPALGPDGTIYVSFDDQYLRAVEPNGTIKWVTSLGWLGAFTLTVGSDGLIYAAGDDGYLYVIDTNGKEIARLESDNWLSHPVIAADGTIIITDSNNMVVAIGGDGCEGQVPALHRPEDLNTDWAMDFIDFAVMAADWLQCTDITLDPETRFPFCDYAGDEIFLAGDINRDQYVDLADLAALAYRWLSED